MDAMVRAMRITRDLTELALPKTREFSRRDFLKLSAKAVAASLVGGSLYSLHEAKSCRVARHSISVPRLPAQFAGTTVAFLSDIHHSAVVSLEYIRRVVAKTNALKPDVILLGGDYITHGREWIEPCMAELGKLRAPAGVFAALGNHDHYGRCAGASSEALQRHRIALLRNCGTWLQRGGERLRIGGVGDLWCDHQDLDAALEDTRVYETALLLSHNPDYVERIRDPRVGLVLSGHTHGGQCVFPLVGAPCVPSRFGQKYLRGLCRGPFAQVFVTSGVGLIAPAVRFNCQPEIALLTLETHRA